MNHLLGLQHRRQYLVLDYTYSKVLSYRQFSPMYLTPGTLSRVTDASLSTAFYVAIQANGSFFNIF